MPSIFDTAFRKTIEALFEEQRSKWSPENKFASPIALQTKEMVAKWNCRAIDEQSLEELMSNAHRESIEFARKKWIMFLPPLEEETKDFVPLLSLEYCRRDQNENGCIKIRVLMISHDESGCLFGIGFRIESPESFCREQRDNNRLSVKHDFYHAQLIRDLGYGPNDLRLPDWLPLTQPSFPLWARNPIDSILTLILSLYGRSYYTQFVTSHGSKFMPQTSREFMSLNEWFKESSH